MGEGDGSAPGARRKEHVGNSQKKNGERGGVPKRKRRKGLSTNFTFSKTEKIGGACPLSFTGGERRGRRKEPIRCPHGPRGKARQPL